MNWSKLMRTDRTDYDLKKVKRNPSMTSTTCLSFCRPKTWLKRENTHWTLITIILTLIGKDRPYEKCFGLTIVCKNRSRTFDGHSLYTLIIFSSLKGSEITDKDSGIQREYRIDRLSTLHMTSYPCLFTMTLSSCEYYSVHQLINSGKGKAISTA